MTPPKANFYTLTMADVSDLVLQCCYNLSMSFVEGKIKMLRQVRLNNPDDERVVMCFLAEGVSRFDCLVKGLV